MARRRRKTRTRRKVRAYAAPRRRMPKRRRRKAYSAAPKRRVAARRKSRRRNPKGFFQSPAVELGAAALLGVGIGAAADAAAKPEWMPAQLQNGHVVGAILAAAGWNLAKGAWRQRLIAAGIGAVGGSFVANTVTPALTGMFDRADASPAFPRGKGNVRYLTGYSAPGMSSQRQALAANGIPV